MNVIAIETVPLQNSMRIIQITQTQTGATHSKGNRPNRDWMCGMNL